MEKLCVEPGTEHGVGFDNTHDTTLDTMHGAGLGGSTITVWILVTPTWDEWG